MQAEKTPLVKTTDTPRNEVELEPIRSSVDETRVAKMKRERLTKALRNIKNVQKIVCENLFTPNPKDSDEIHHSSQTTIQSTIHSPCHCYETSNGKKLSPLKILVLKPDKDMPFFFANKYKRVSSTEVFYCVSETLKIPLRRNRLSEKMTRYWKTHYETFLQSKQPLTHKMCFHFFENDHKTNHEFILLLISNRTSITHLNIHLNYIHTRLTEKKLVYCCMFLYEKTDITPILDLLHK